MWQSPDFSGNFYQKVSRLQEGRGVLGKKNADSKLYAEEGNVTDMEGDLL